jgi:hypothetical protein
VKKKNCKTAVFFLIFFWIILLAACGLEDYPEIYPVRQYAHITQYMNDRAVVRITNDNAPPSMFTHFAIFYRIYVSDQLELSTTINDAHLYSGINPTLGQDYSAILPYIDSDTLVNSNMDSVIRVNRRYQYLSLNGADIDSVLSTSCLGSTIEFNFTTGNFPSMTLGGTTYYLQRSSALPNALPDPNFLNTPELWDSANINDNVNADVANKSNLTIPEPHTYAALFIAAVGMNRETWTSAYSTPSLIHVFLLPQSF